MISRHAAYVLLTALLITATSGGQAGADEISLKSGLYEVSFRLELPHLEKYAIDRQTTACVDQGKSRQRGTPLPLLSQNGIFANCRIENLQENSAGFRYDIICAGRDAARATAAYTLAPDVFTGRIAIVQGAKNMTMTEVQRGRRLGSCDVESIRRKGHPRASS